MAQQVRLRRRRPRTIAGRVGVLLFVVLSAWWGWHPATTTGAAPLPPPGEVYSWGNNIYGVLGRPTNAPTPAPDPNPAPTLKELAGQSIIGMESGGLYTLVITGDGRVYSWGENSRGQLGRPIQSGCGSTPCDPQIKPIGGELAGRTVSAVAAGGYHALALTPAGELYSWGDNSSGQLGRNDAGPCQPGDTPCAPFPGRVMGPVRDGTIVAVAGGGFHSLALLSDGTVYAWGQNDRGQLGYPTTGRDSQLPQRVIGLPAGEPIIAISAGPKHSLALTASGTIYSWGLNLTGELGRISPEMCEGEPCIRTPGPIAGVLQGRKVTRINGRGFHNLALTAEGHVYSWGDDNFGSLGRATAPFACLTGGRCSLEPGRVEGALSGETIIDIATSSHSVALAKSGRVYTWGNNSAGALGRPTNGNFDPRPGLVGGALSGHFVRAIVAGYLHTLVITDPTRPPTPVTTEEVCFSETGRCIRGRFLDYWRGNGGLAQQGYPITDEFDEVNPTDGKIYLTQYFERARFEYHPENNPPYDVLLGLLGREQFKARYRFPPNPISGNPFDPAAPANQCPSITNGVDGGEMCGLFGEYWRANGALEQQGLPISAAFWETNPTDGRQYITQYFERARFEYHPDNPEPYKVLLGLLGSEQYQAKYLPAKATSGAP